MVKHGKNNCFHELTYTIWNGIMLHSSQKIERINYIVNILHYMQGVGKNTDTVPIHVSNISIEVLLCIVFLSVVHSFTDSAVKKCLRSALFFLFQILGLLSVF